jgi:NAD-dependent deacetylase
VSIDEVAGWVAAATHAVVLTGAGISTESGISDFRGPKGVWTLDPAAERRANIETWMSEPDLRRERWRAVIDNPPFDRVPNAGHLAIAELDRRGQLHLLATQNVDRLHHASGVDPERIVELHGNSREFMCMGCGMRGPIDDLLDRVRAGDDDPHCEVCFGILKTATVSFGQALFPGDIERAQRATLGADLFLAVGSTLGVFPAASLVPMAKQAGARVVIVNDSETPFDPIADAVLRGRIGQVLPAIVGTVATASNPDPRGSI